MPRPAVAGGIAAPRVRTRHGRSGRARRGRRRWNNRAKREVPFTGLDLTADEVDMHLSGHSKQETRRSRGPGLRPIHLSWGPEFKVMVVLTLKGKGFVCVEPWTAVAGTLATDEGLLHVQPDERLSLAFDIEV